MCILFSYVARRLNSNQYKLIILNNRDEFHFRPSKPAEYVTDHSIYGMDLTSGKEGGTWMGTSRMGKIAVLLNLNSVDYGNEIDSKEGRGFLVPNFLHTDLDASTYVETIKEVAKLYNPFNIVFFERKKNDLWDAKIFDNVSCELKETDEEYVSISNHQYKSKIYPKTIKGDKMFKEIVAKFNNPTQKSQLIDSLINLAKYSTEKYNDSIDQHAYTREQICINFPDYGTRTHTILLVDHENRVTINEQTMKCPINSENPIWEETKIEFVLDQLDNK